MITAMPTATVADDSGCLLIFTGPVNRYVTWGLTGSGTLTVLSALTDVNGMAFARYTAGTAGDTPTVTVKYAS